jgi:molecular chaperone DnaK
MEKLVRENREKLPESDVKPVEEALEKAKGALAGGDLATIQAATQALDAASHKVAEVLYRSTQAAGAAAGSGAPGGATGDGTGSSGGAGPKGGQGDVIDAEYVDVDESKKPN